MQTTERNKLKTHSGFSLWSHSHVAVRRGETEHGEQSHSSQKSRNRAGMALLVGAALFTFIPSVPGVLGVAARSQDGFFPLVIPLWQTPQRHAQQCVLLSTEANLKAIKWTVKINHRSSSLLLHYNSVVCHMCLWNEIIFCREIPSE